MGEIKYKNVNFLMAVARDKCLVLCGFDQFMILNYQQELSINFIYNTFIIITHARTRERMHTHTHTFWVQIVK